MSLAQDLALFRAKLNTAIDTVMQSYVAAAAENELTKSIQENVYDEYLPKMYERRKFNGGLIDVSRDNWEENYDSQTKTLTIRNINRDDETGRLVAPVVESGQGYTYKAIPPRPFHKPAEEAMITDGHFEEALDFGLTALGFKTERA